MLHEAVTPARWLLAGEGCTGIRIIRAGPLIVVVIIGLVHIEEFLIKEKPLVDSALVDSSSEGEDVLQASRPFHHHVLGEQVRVPQT